MPTLIIVRHGESEFNKSDLFCGWIDAELSENGRIEAENAGKLLKKFNLKPDIVYTSRLSRSCVTQAITLEHADRVWIDVKRSWRLNERHYGALQGQKKSDILQKYGKDQFMKWRRSYDVRPPPIDDDSKFSEAHDQRYRDLEPNQIPHAECLKDVTQRLLPYWNDNIARDLLDDKQVLIIAHGSTARALCKYLDNISDQDISHLNIPTGIPLVYELDTELKPIKPRYYLDPKAAIEGAAKVAAQGQGSSK